MSPQARAFVFTALTIWLRMRALWRFGDMGLYFYDKGHIYMLDVEWLVRMRPGNLQVRRRKVPEVQGGCR